MLVQEDIYKIDILTNIFHDHAKDQDIQNAKNRDLYENIYPEEELPHHLENGFNLSKALFIICSEINLLKGKC